jgi:hypothetical protein
VRQRFRIDCRKEPLRNLHDRRRSDVDAVPPGEDAPIRRQLVICYEESRARTGRRKWDAGEVDALLGEYSTDRISA